MVVVDLVVARPQPLVGGDRHEQRPAGRDDAAQLAQGGEVVLEVLDHVERCGQLEAVGGERHLQHRAFDHLAGVTRARKRGARGGQLDSCDRAVVGELDHVAPAATAGVEDLRARGQAQLRDHPLEHAAPPPVPPVAILSAVRL
jgi:hypothetical protein